MVVGALWVLLTVLLEWWALGSELHPLGGSREAEIVDEAFDLLLYLGIPVFAFVISVLAYSIVSFRAGGGQGDGPPVRTNKIFVSAWVGLSTFLAVFVIFNPGLKGMAELDEAAEHPDMTIDVIAEQWSWTYSYIDAGVTLEDADELVLPNETTILFRITSEDVIHSFWVPAFRVKMDAVPGKVTEIAATTTEVGEFSEDVGYRVQCAELCGTGHARMRNRVVVLEPDEFESWLAGREGTG